MKERPILFSTPMVRALIAGTKTQTRRIIKLPHNNSLGQWEPTIAGGKGCYLDKAMTKPAPEQAAIWHTRTGDCIVYGSEPGSRLWVRETWAKDPDGQPCYRADVTVGLRSNNYADQLEHDRLVGERWAHWRPSIFMPRKFSRITLEITGVRVERLNDISEKDAVSEGCKEQSSGHTAREDYLDLWEQINGAGSWAINPWVWVVEFKRLTARAKGE